MSTQLDTPTPSAPTSEPNSTSLESWLQNRRAQLQEKHEHDLAVPGFEGRLFGVYHTPAYAELRAIGRRNEQLKLDESTQELYGFADLIINACDRIYAVGEDGSTADLPKWSVDLARKFGIDNPEVNTARKAVLAIFDGHETNLAQHAAELVEAMQGTNEETDEQLAGESEAAA
jgi:hypothetical protein